MKRIDAAKRFIDAWSSSRNAVEVAGKLKSTTRAVQARAKYFRKHGIPLKRLPGSKTLDWGALAEYAKKASR